LGGTHRTQICKSDSLTTDDKEVTSALPALDVCWLATAEEATSESPSQRKVTFHSDYPVSKADLPGEFVLS